MVRKYRRCQGNRCRDRARDESSQSIAPPRLLHRNPTCPCNRAPAQKPKDQCGRAGVERCERDDVTPCFECTPRTAKNKKGRAAVLRDPENYRRLNLLDFFFLCFVRRNPQRSQEAL